MAQRAPTLWARDLPLLLEKQRRELLRRGRSPHTVEIYTWGVRTLIKHIGNPDGQVVDRDLLEDWQDSLIERLNERSRSLAATSVRQLIKWATDRDVPLCDARLERAIVGVKTHKKQPRPLHPNDLIRIEAHLTFTTSWELAGAFQRSCKFTETPLSGKSSARKAAAQRSSSVSLGLPA